MTDEQKAVLDSVFQRYGRECTEWSQNVNVWATRADQLDTINGVKSQDRRTADKIAQLEKIVEALKVYRISLCERYGELTTAPTVPLVRLCRKRGLYGDNKIYYYLEEYTRNIETGERIKVDTTTFTGKQRHEAIAAYREYVKAHPGIECEMDIEKHSWER